MNSHQRRKARRQQAREMGAQEIVAAYNGFNMWLDTLYYDRSLWTHARSPEVFEAIMARLYLNSDHA